MIEEELEVGGRRPPDSRGTRLGTRLGDRLRARLGRRAPGVLAAVALLAASGWALAHGALDDPPATPRRAATTPTAAPSSHAPLTGSDEELAERTIAPPGLPYLRLGVLHTSDGRQRALPEGPWRDFGRLSDGRVVLVGDGSVTVAGKGARRATYPMKGELARQRDGAAVAWTAPDGTVMRLTAGQARPAGTESRLLSPACRGWRVSPEPRETWESCDERGDPLSPDGRYVARARQRRVTIGLRYGSPVLDARIGRVVDLAWESDRALLVVTFDAGTEMFRLSRMDATTGAFDDLLSQAVGEDPQGAALVLP